MFQKLSKRIQNMIKRGFVTNLNDDSGDFPKVQASYLGKVTDVETIWPYGMSAMPPNGALLVIFNIQGQEEYKVAVCSDPQFRFKGLLPGETVFGNNEAQTKIYFKADGSIEIDADPAQNVTINAKQVVVNATDFIVNGDIKATGDIVDNYQTNAATMADFRTIYNEHTHDETGTVTHIPNQLI